LRFFYALSTCFFFSSLCFKIHGCELRVPKYHNIVIVNLFNSAVSQNIGLRVGFYTVKAVLYFSYNRREYLKLFSKYLPRYLKILYSTVVFLWKAYLFLLIILKAKQVSKSASNQVSESRWKFDKIL
jgi:hypothetical protein